MYDILKKYKSRWVRVKYVDSVETPWCVVYCVYEDSKGNLYHDISDDSDDVILGGKADLVDRVDRLVEIHEDKRREGQS